MTDTVSVATRREFDRETLRVAHNAGGPPMRSEGLWQTFSWSAQRLSDRPGMTEKLTEAMGVLLIGLFIACALATASSSHGPGWVALWIVPVAVFAWLTLSGPMQYRHRARLGRRLRETGVRAKGVITDMWVLEAGSGICAMIHYTIRTQDGVTRTYLAFDETSIVLRRKLGDAIEVLYDPDRPCLAIVDDN